MASTLTHAYPQYTWLFLAVRRSDMQGRPHRRQVNAPDYSTARQLIAGEYVAVFAGRLPCASAVKYKRVRTTHPDYFIAANPPAYTFAP